MDFLRKSYGESLNAGGCPVQRTSHWKSIKTKLGIYRLRRYLAARRAAAAAKSASRNSAHDRVVGIEDVLGGGSSYEAWMRRDFQQRAARYPYLPEPGLLSLITAVWNTPPRFLQTLAKSVFAQQTAQPFEWVVLDNGSQAVETREYLDDVICRHPCVKYVRMNQNVGIVRGMRQAMDHATGRYLLHVDHDDYLYPDCISIVTSAIQHSNYPPMLYSDEDYVQGTHSEDPYFKPDWDPVLFLNSAYIAHLAVVDRELGKQLEILTDPEVEGSADWDAFARFVAAGYTPAHIPEILYSWRKHENSTASNTECKSYIYSSQRKVLERYLDAGSHGDRFSVELSPFFNGAPDWHLRRQAHSASPLTVIVLGGSPRPGRRHKVLDSFQWPGHVAIGFPLDRSLHNLSHVVAQHASRDGLVAFVSDRVEIQNREWAWEALGLMELHSDLVLVGGRIYRPDAVVTDAGHYWGFGRGCDCPDRGRLVTEVGYHTQMFKQRSVDAVPLQFCVFKAEFLLDLLASRSVRQNASLFSLHMWAGAAASRMGARVAYSPFLTAKTTEDWSLRISEEDLRNVVRGNADLLRESKNYSRHLDLSGARPYREATAADRRNHLEGMLSPCGLHLDAVFQSPPQSRGACDGPPRAGLRANRLRTAT